MNQSFDKYQRLLHKKDESTPKPAIVINQFTRDVLRQFRNHFYDKYEFYNILNSIQQEQRKIKDEEAICLHRELADISRTFIGDFAEIKKSWMN